MLNLKTGKNFSPVVDAPSNPSRRSFLKGGLAAILASGLAPSLCGSITRGLGYRNLGGRLASIGGGGSKPYDSKVEWIRIGIGSYLLTDIVPKFTPSTIGEFSIKYSYNYEIGSEQKCLFHAAMENSKYLNFYMGYGWDCFLFNGLYFNNTVYYKSGYVGKPRIYTLLNDGFLYGPYGIETKKTPSNYTENLVGCSGPIKFSVNIYGNAISDNTLYHVYQKNPDSTYYFNLIPVRVDGNGALYDEVGNKLYTGVGEITYGNDVE